MMMDQPSMTPPLIDIQSVTYRYPVPTTARLEDQHVAPALKSISLQIPPGEYVALLGHNGCGKSTLARHCNALLLPDEGRVQVEGMDTRDATKQSLIRARVGMIFQNPDNQLIATVVEDDVAWSLTVLGFPAAEIRQRVDEALEAVGIAHLRYLPPHKLSGGQRQRLAVAGILALRPRCIIADEATSMLDPVSRQEIGQLFAQLHRDLGLTIIMVTHLLEEATLAQRVVLMERGQIIDQGTPAQMFADLERLRALKLIIPEPLLLADRLRASGFSIAQEAVTIEAIAQEIAHA
jgi:energy-coupling factor transport system ATP-binding protein